MKAIKDSEFGAASSGAPQKTLKKTIVPVFAGGGTRLSAHIGVLKALEELGIGFSAVVGVSGGSIVSALYCAGYKTPQIEQLTLATDFAQFSGQSFWNLIRTGGLSTGAKLEHWLNDLLGGVTFEQLSIPFNVVATDVRTGQPVIFNKETTPDLAVAKAVRYSMSIPLLFSFSEYRSHLLVDGSILSEDALQRDWSGEGLPIIVFRLRSAQSTAAEQRRRIFPIKIYLSLLIRTFMTTMSREYINDNFWHSTIVIDTGNISPVDFTLDEQTKKDLINAGYETCLNILPIKLGKL